VIPVEPHGLALSHYRLERVLGRGGMAEVYLATDTALGRQAAVKIVDDAVDPSIRQRLVREARASARLQHPAIATFYEAGEIDGTNFIAMEYVPGITLREKLKGGPLAVGDAIGVATMLLEALHHAHAAGLVHRDIKPDNVIITPSGAVKLLDFGLALIVATAEAAGDATLLDLTRDRIVGTPGYMAPEQVQGLPIDARVDLFGVGALLYEMLAGRPAFAGTTIEDRFVAVLARDPLPIGRADVTPEMSGLVLRALAREPQKRYVSASAFLAELRAVTQDRDMPRLPHTLVVADLANLSGSRDDDWIGSGIAESVIADLTRVSGLAVVSRDQVLRASRAQGAGGRAADPLMLAVHLGCRFAVSGSYQRIGDAIRVTAHLVEAATGRVVATEKVDGRMADIFAIQDDLAHRIIEQLDVKGPSKAVGRPNDLGAFECYARGRRRWVRLEKGGFDAARALFERAVALQPTLAPALAGLAAVHALRFTFTTDPADLDAAAAYAQRALAVQPDNGEAHIWLGYALSRQGRPDEAAAEVRLAHALDPTNFLGTYFLGAIEAFRHRYDDAIAAFQRAIAISPGAGFPWIGLGSSHLELCRFAEARWCFERAIATEAGGEQPTSGAGALLAECLRRMGDHGGARAAALAALDAVEKADHIYRDTFRAIALVSLGRSVIEQGDVDAADAAFSQAIFHLRGRPRMLGGGHLLVQALAGRARARVDTDAFLEALDVLEQRRPGNFSDFWTCDNGHSLLDLARAAAAVGRSEESATLLRRAVDSGSSEATALTAAR
jgi:eukaryotic-like serine/threonine-protein kinase